MKTAKKSLSVLLALCMIMTLFTCIGAATVSAQAAPTTANAAYHMKSNHNTENDVQVGILNTDLVEGETYTFSVDYYTVANGFFTNGAWGFASGWSGPQYANYRSAGKGHIEFSFTADAPSANVDAKAAQGGDGSQFASATGIAFHVFASGEYYLWNAQFKDADGNVLPNTYVIKWACNGGQNYLYETMTKADLPICVDGLHNYQQVDVQAATCQAGGTANLVCAKCGITKSQAEVEGFTVDEDGLVGIFDFTTVQNPDGNDTYFMCRPKSAWTTQHVKYTFDYYMDAPMLARAGNNMGKDYSGGNFQQGYHHYEGNNDIDPDHAYLQIKVIRKPEWGGTNETGHIYIWNLKAINADTGVEFAEFGYNDGAVPNYCAYGTGPSALPAAVIETDPTPHNYVLDEENSTAATCTTPGKSTYVCSYCGRAKNILDVAAGEAAPTGVIYYVNLNNSEKYGQPGDYGICSSTIWSQNNVYQNVAELEFDYYLTENVRTEVGDNGGVNWNATEGTNANMSLLPGFHHYKGTSNGAGRAYAMLKQFGGTFAPIYIWNMTLKDTVTGTYDTRKSLSGWYQIPPDEIAIDDVPAYEEVAPATAAGHNFVATTVDGDCQTPATTTYVCSICGHVKNEADANTEVVAPLDNQAVYGTYNTKFESDYNIYNQTWIMYDFGNVTEGDEWQLEFDYYASAANYHTSNWWGVSLDLTPNGGNYNFPQGLHHFSATQTITAANASRSDGHFMIQGTAPDDTSVFVVWNTHIYKNGVELVGGNDGFPRADRSNAGGATYCQEAFTKTGATLGFFDVIEEEGELGAHAFGEWVFTEETTTNDASATRTCAVCGETETVAAKDIVKADWATHYADAKGGSSQYPGCYLGHIGSLEADDVVTVEFDYSHPDYDAATNILKIRSNNGESASEFNLVEDGVVTTNRTIKGTGGHVVATYVNTQARGEIYAGLQESVHKGADDVYVWNIKFYVNGEEVTSDKDAFDNIAINNSDVVLSHPYAIQLQIGTQRKGNDARFIIKLSGNAEDIEAYENITLDYTVDGEKFSVTLDSVYDSFIDEYKTITAESLNCTYVAILEIGDVTAANEITATASYTANGETVIGATRVTNAGRIYKSWQ